MEANWIMGDRLSPALQAEALRRYVHRYTGNHKPDWVRGGMPDGNPYPLQFADDADWLAHTQFAMNKRGDNFDNRHHACMSFPTWPNGKPEVAA